MAFLTKDIPVISSGLNTMEQLVGQERQQAIAEQEQKRKELLAQTELARQSQMDALHFAGMQEYQSNVAAGMPPEEALRRAAPKLYAGGEHFLGNMIHETQPPEPIYRSGPGGAIVRIDRNTGEPETIVPGSTPPPRRPNYPPHINVGGILYEADSETGQPNKDAQGNMIPIPGQTKPPKELTEAQKQLTLKRLQDAREKLSKAKENDLGEGAIAAAAAEEQDILDELQPGRERSTAVKVPHVTTTPGGWFSKQQSTTNFTNVPIPPNPFKPNVVAPPNQAVDQDVSGLLNKNQPFAARFNSPAPLPKSKKDLVVGQSYQSKGRTWKWDGEQLVGE